MYCLFVNILIDSLICFHIEMKFMVYYVVLILTLFSSSETAYFFEIPFVSCEIFFASWWHVWCDKKRNIDTIRVHIKH